MSSLEEAAIVYVKASEDLVAFATDHDPDTDDEVFMGALNSALRAKNEAYTALAIEVSAATHE